MHQHISTKKPQFQAAVDHLSGELATLRTGRATPAVVESIKVPAYDSMMELKGVAAIRSLDAKTLVVEPWDKSVTQAIEKAIRDAQIGVNPAVDGNTIRLSFPPMTEENRKNLVKHMKGIIEETRVRIRGVRESVRDEVSKMEKNKDISEDEKFNMFDDLDKMTKEFTTQVDEMGKAKEQEIMTV